MNAAEEKKNSLLKAILSETFSAPSVKKSLAGFQELSLRQKKE
jgi:hypothetical protein